MADRVTVLDRCLAIQMQREIEAPCSAVDPFARNSRYPNTINGIAPQPFASLPRVRNGEVPTTAPRTKFVSTSNPSLAPVVGVGTATSTASPSSGTPTPTNPKTPLMETHQVTTTSKNLTTNSYQEGYELFRVRAFSYYIRVIIK